MGEANHWGLARCAILLAVLLLHLALLAALLLSSRTGSPLPAAQAVELLYLPPATLPPVRSQAPPPPRLSSGASLMMASAPVLASTSQSAMPSSSIGSGSGVDWAAEARRALQAFEIRSHQPQGGNSVPIDPAEDNWWPRGRHRAGDQFKTPNGDWVVWVNDRCYQVAGLGSSAYAVGATPPQTVCPADGRSRE